MAKPRYSREELKLLIEKFAKKGFRDKEIAAELGYTKWYFSRIVNNDPELKAILDEARKDSAKEVEGALFKKATGFFVEEITVELKNAGKPTETKTIKKTKRYIPPSDTAIIFWLKNRRPREWQDTYAGRVEDIMKISVIERKFSKLTPKELYEIATAKVNESKKIVQGN